MCHNSGEKGGMWCPITGKKGGSSTLTVIPGKRGRGMRCPDPVPIPDPKKLRCWRQRGRARGRRLRVEG